MEVLVASIISDTLIVFAIPLHLILMATCIKYRLEDPFRSSFFALMFSQGIADLMSIAVMYTILKPAVYYGLFRDIYLSYPLLFGRLQPYLSLGLTWSQHFCFLSIAFNRFTAVCLPIRHHEIWQTKTTRLAIIAQWLILLLIPLPVLTFDIRYTPQSNGSCLGSSCLGIVWEKNNNLSIYYMITFAYISAVVIICGILYALQYRTTWKHRTQVATISNQARIELRLALLGAVIFAISSSYLLYLIISILANSIVQTTFDLAWLYFFMTDFIASINPFILIGMSKQVRRKCFDLLRGA